MGNNDTLAIAEERVLRLVQRRAIQEAGLYIESTFQDMELASSGKSFQSSSLEICTIAAAITKTEVLESRRSFENDRPSFYVRIRPVVDIDNPQGQFDGKLGQPTQAIDDLSAILRADPTDKQALLARAALYQEELQGRSAKDDIERACMLGATAACEQLP